MRTCIKPPQLLLMVLCAAMPLAAQSAATEVYAQSYRQGSTKVVEDSFDIKLTPQDPIFRERIKDLGGTDRYAFSIIPKGPEGDTKITSWQGTMADLQHPIYDNVLLVSPNPSDDPKEEAKNALCRLWPSTFALVPVGARRIMKVDNFYVVLQVKAYDFTPPESPYLDSMTVHVEFRNTDPRQAGVSGK
ncbi:MAG: hypothetical protein WA416_15980 [Candidatus Sulfotelmatobacter sp.]